MLIISRFIRNCMIYQQLKVNIEHLLYPSQANLSHGRGWIRPSKILLRYNTYVRTNNYIDQIYSNAHIVPWSCRFWFQSLFKYTSYGSKLYYDDISQFGTFYSISIAIRQSWQCRAKFSNQQKNLFWVFETSRGNYIVTSLKGNYYLM